MAEIDLDSLSGRMLGEFVLRERLDEGGFGAVYRCVQPLLGRYAVVKVLFRSAEIDDASARERFTREAQLASRLSHPYAAHVYAFGVDPQDGLCWIAMELVDGKTLTRWLTANGPMPIEQLVPFFDRVAEVVQAAHEQGIVHRDLKPSNIMVIERAGRLLPKLLDLGVAKIIGELAADEPTRWAGGSIGGQHHTDDKTPVLRRSRRRGTDGDRLTPDDVTLGSPPYMSPEQWTNPSAVGPEADIYALGAIAFEILTGRKAFDADNLKALTDLHCEGAIPSTGSPGLDAILHRALAKRPADRWPSALGFAAALRAELDARTAARLGAAAKQWLDRGRSADLLWRGAELAAAEQWARRSGRGAATPIDLEFLDVCRAATEATAQAEASRRTWLRRGAVAAGLTIAASVGGVAWSREHLRAELASDEIAQIALTAEVEQGRQALLHGEFADARQHLGRAYRQLGDRSPATAFMFARALDPLLAQRALMPAASGRAWSAGYSPDEQRIATTDDVGAQIWDAQTHQRLLQLPHLGSVYGAVWSADGLRLTTVTDAAVRIWDARTGAVLQELQQPRLDSKRADYYRIAVAGDVIAAIDASGAEVHVWIAGAPTARLRTDVAAEFPALAFSSDGRWLAATGGEGVTIWDAATWAPAAQIRGPRAHALAWDPTGPRLLIGTVCGDAAVYDAATGARLRHLREIGEPIGAVAWSADGRWIAIGEQDGTEQTWDAATGEPHGRANYLHGRVQVLAFGAGDVLAAAAAAGGIAVAGVDLGMPRVVLDGPGIVRSLRLSAGADRVLVAAEDGSSRLWDAREPYQRSGSAPLGEAGCGILGGAEPDTAGLLAVPCLDRPTRIWRRGELIAELPAVTAPGGDFQPAFPVVLGDRAAIARGAAVEIYGLPDAVVVGRIEHGAPVTAIALGPAGLVSGDARGEVRLDGRPLPAASAGVDAVLWLSDARIAVADAARRLRVLSVHGEVLADLALPTRARMLRTSGARLVVVGSYLDKTPPTLWDLDRYRIVADLSAHIGPVFLVRVTDAGIVTTGSDGFARLWDTQTGRLIQAYRGSPKYLADATVSGDLLVGGGAGGDLRFWDLSTGRLLWLLHAHTSAVVGISASGSDIVTRTARGEVARWTLPAPASVIDACGGSEGADGVGGLCGTVAP